MVPDTRRRMLAGASRMIGTRGAGATSLRELARECEVPLGSTYHHFPGGKAQLVNEAVAATGRQVARLMEKAREEGVEASLTAFADVWRSLLLETDFRTGCPVLAVATEADPAYDQTARTVFRSWQSMLADGLVEGGVPAARAPSLARLVIASLEGAVAVCRAERSVDPLDEVVGEVAALVRSARVPAAG